MRALPLLLLLLFSAILSAFGQFVTRTVTGPPVRYQDWAPGGHRNWGGRRIPRSKRAATVIVVDHKTEAQDTAIFPHSESYKIPVDVPWRQRRLDGSRGKSQRRCPAEQGQALHPWAGYWIRVRSSRHPERPGRGTRKQPNVVHHHSSAPPQRRSPSDWTGLPRAFRRVPDCLRSTAPKQRTWMRSLLSLFLLATVTQQRTGFDGLRSTLIKFLTEETRGDVSQVVLLTRRDMWMNVSRVAMNPLLNLEEKELKIKVNTVLEKSGETIRSMVGRLQEIYEKSRVFGVLGVETFRACCLVGFSPRFLEASVGNKTKMVEKILIRAPPTQEEAEARFLEDMLVDITVTPNFTESMTEQEKSRIDFLLDSIRISGEATKSQEEKEMAVVVQFKRNSYLRRFFLEYLRDFNVEDLAARIVQQFSWIQIAASKEQFAQMTREQKIEEVIKGVKKTFSHTVKV